MSPPRIALVGDYRSEVVAHQGIDAFAAHLRHIVQLIGSYQHSNMPVLVHPHIMMYHFVLTS